MYNIAEDVKLSEDRRADWKQFLDKYPDGYKPSPYKREYNRQPEYKDESLSDMLQWIVIAPKERAGERYYQPLVEKILSRNNALRRPSRAAGKLTGAF